MLEPANTSTSNQNEQEEIREVSLQLAGIKKQHDDTKKIANAKQEELEKIRKKIDQLYVQEVQAEGPTAAMRNGLEILDQSLKDTRNRIDQEVFTQ